jgi:hypothetical protein
VLTRTVLVLRSTFLGIAVKMLMMDDIPSLKLMAIPGQVDARGADVVSIDRISLAHMISWYSSSMAK